MAAAVLSAVQRLKQFTPLDRLSEDQLILLAERLSLRRLKAGQQLFESGSCDGNDYFLLEGSVCLRQGDGLESSVAADDPEASLPIARGEPRTCDAYASEGSTFVVVPADVLRQLLQAAPLDDESAENKTDTVADDDYAVLMEFYRDLRANKVTLPSLPDIAMRIRRVADAEGSSAEDIGRVVSADPAIAAKLLRACNSPLYRGFSEIATTREAVVRLGLRTTRQLVTVFSMRELFKSKRPELQAEMARLWDHSREVAAISWVLARALPGVDPEEALLAGLLHDIGTIPVLQYADHYVSLFADGRRLDETSRSLRGEIGQALLEHWDFPPRYGEVARHAEDWLYDTGDEQVHLVDIVIIAQLHAYIGKHCEPQLPAFFEVPAFQRMQCLELGPQQSLRVISEARTQIGALHSLLTGR
ncbi:HDOD domain-containing protein [Mangrovitalea sediminis]|uniref:HDOD domain-containing protein n=1 Tax=Mangrovitalea sediminis TaxID=1982043 RepID=UPI000BE5CF69|nr:HDOD domain-containing protein [Mangrovitalea sediminis]